jgi:DNA-binding response OmpR family regulator
MCVKEVWEAGDGIDGLEAIRSIGPDIVILDWELPLLNGAGLIRIVRSPGVFPMPDVPIIMLSSHGERWRVIEAARIGVNEYLVKPVSAQALRDRMVSILVSRVPSCASAITVRSRAGNTRTDPQAGRAVAPPRPSLAVNRSGHQPFVGVTGC